jgi:hypothetical protein
VEDVKLRSLQMLKDVMSSYHKPTECASPFYMKTCVLRVDI